MNWEQNGGGVGYARPTSGVGILTYSTHQRKEGVSGRQAPTVRTCTLVAMPRLVLAMIPAVPVFFKRVGKYSATFFDDYNRGTCLTDVIFTH